MIAWLVYQAADVCVRVLPGSLADRLCLFLARLAFRLGLPARKAQEDNLARLLTGAPPRTIRRRAREAFEHFALSFTDFLRLGHLDLDQVRDAIEVHGVEHFEAAQAARRGVILLSAHLGNWELGAAYLATRGQHVHVVARPHGSRLVEWFFARRRRAWGIRTIAGRPLWTHAARALRRGEWVAVMADRLSSDPDGSRSGSVCAWVAALSRRTGAVVLPAVMVHLPNRRYAAYFEAPVAPGAVRGQSFRDILHRYLERYPGQWFAFEPMPEPVN